MISPVKVPLSSLPAHITGLVDIFICSASFESRCRSVSDFVEPPIVQHVLVCVNENFPDIVSSNGEYLLSRYAGKSAMVLLSTENPLQTADSLQEAVGATLDEPPQTYLVDITTFTHEALLILLKVLQLRLKMADSVTFVYATAAEYSVGDKDEDKWLSKGIGEVRSVLGYPGRILPTRKSHLVIMAGFESERADRLIEEYEPNRISLGLGDPTSSISPDHYSVNRAIHAKIRAKYTDVMNFTFSCLDPIVTKSAVKAHIQLLPDHNVLIAPMNTKISTIGVALLAFEDNSVQLCYATAHQYNERNYSRPGDDCYLFSVPGLRGPHV
jgi:hypothetical protein